MELLIILILSQIICLETKLTSRQVEEWGLRTLTERNHSRVCHNLYRSRHGAPPLVTEMKMFYPILDYVIRWRKSGELPPWTFPWGRNVYSFKARTNHEDFAMISCDKWYSTVNQYNFISPNDPQNVKKANSFTQMVWKNTKRICSVYDGYFSSNNKSKVYMSFIVASYDPPGNIKNGYCENVLPPISSSVRQVSYLTAVAVLVNLLSQSFFI